MEVEQAEHKGICSTLFNLVQDVI